MTDPVGRGAAFMGRDGAAFPGRDGGAFMGRGSPAVWSAVGLLLIYAVLAAGPGAPAGGPPAKPPLAARAGDEAGEAGESDPGQRATPESAEDAPPHRGPLDPAVARRFVREPEITVFDHAIGAPRTMALEAYVAHVVAGEVRPTWQPDALRAQAVAARTYTVGLLMAGDRTTPRRLYGTDTSTDPAEVQAYSPMVPRAVEKAVAATRGEILVYEGKPIVALFHACAAGRTAFLRESFPRDPRRAPYLRPVPSPCERAAPEAIRRWAVALTAAELAAAAGLSPADVREVHIAARGPSGRAVAIQIGPRRVHAADLRRHVGPNRLRSTLLTAIQPLEGGVWIFRGRGWGHGVGLDQWGAEAMARRGRSYRDILAHYYPGTRLVRLYP
ncbi:MAG TPA: SpoIID/LytB domain-containing protein [Thermaerobacter sp.]